jgi:hypothetical protein
MRHRTNRAPLTPLGPTAAVACAALLVAAGARRGGAQVYASEHAQVAQTVNGTTITVEYYRPKARGRQLFGERPAVVKWGDYWTPGANWATTIDVDQDVRIEGQALPKGKYSVWATPRQDEWTVVLSRKARAFHTRPPGAEDEQLRFTVKPGQGPHVEVLTWSFPAVEKDGAELHLQWGTTDVALHLGIGPAAAVAAALGPEERAAYVGVYRMTNLSPNARIKTSTYTVFDSAGVLRLRRSDPPDRYYDAQFDLHRTGEHTFVPIMYRNGALVGVEPAIRLVFTFEGGRATGVETYFAANDAVTARGTLERP